MPIKLKVTNESDPSKSRDYIYDQEAILIGRDIKADLQLE